MSKTKVAIVVHDFDTGFGQGRYCIELVRRLNADFEFAVFSNTFVYEGPGNVRHVPITAWRSKAITTIFSFVAAAEWALRGFGDSLIHSQGLASWRADVVTAHLSNTTRYRQSPPVSLKGKLFGAAVPPLEHAFYRHNRRASLISISKSVQQEIETDYGWEGDRQVIYHGTDSQRFSPAAIAEKLSWQRRYGLLTQHWNWLFMGEASKGLAECITALKEFPQAQLLVISRSDAMPWQALARTLGVAAQLRWHGYDATPENAFKAVDVFCYPSDYDAFGMVVAEAMASGLPVIVGRDIGAAELLRHGENGLVCAARDTPSLVQALKRLSQNPDLAKQLGLAARASILGHSWDRCAAATAAVYERALQKPLAASA